MPHALLIHLNPLSVRRFYAVLLFSGGFFLFGILCGLTMAQTTERVDPVSEFLSSVARGPRKFGLHWIRGLWIRRLWIRRLWIRGLPGRFAAQDGGSGGERRDPALGRRVLKAGLGLFWVLDGLLQAQPAMGSSVFVNEVFKANLSGQPSWYRMLLESFIRIWDENLVLMSVASVYIQLGLGAMILLGRNGPVGKIGLWLSIAWGAGVWVFGEGMGGILTGRPTWLSGDPGAVLLYIAGAALLLMPSGWWRNGRVTGIVAWGMAGYWFCGALVQALPGDGFWTSRGLSAVFLSVAANPQGAWTAAPIDSMAAAAKSAPVFWNAFFAAAMAAVGFGFLQYREGVKKWSWAGVILVWLAFIWWVGQDFGVLGGVGTDPNSAPLAALLMVGAWLLPDAPGLAQTTEKQL